MTLLHPAVYSRARTSISLFGPGGSGKSLTALLIALGVSIERHNKAPIALVDPEDVSDFLLKPCDVEGVPLFIVKTRTFVDMRDALAEAEQQGCCAFIVDHLDAINRELVESQRRALDLQGRRLPYHDREELIRLWDEWVRRFRASSCHCLFTARLGWLWGDDEDDAGEPTKVKLGTKARGDADADYEPDLLIEMELIERRQREQRTRAKRLENIHMAYVRKDRAQVLSGMQFQWKDFHGYQQGDYEAVYACLEPHFKALAARDAGLVAREGVARSSAELFSKPLRESSYTERQRRIAQAIEEIKASMTMTFGAGRDGASEKLRLTALSILFGTRSWTAIEAKPMEVVESGRTVMLAFEDTAKNGEASDLAKMTALLQACKDAEKERIGNMVF